MQGSGKVKQIISPFHYIISLFDQEKLIFLELNPTPNIYFLHLIEQLATKKVTYTLQKNKRQLNSTYCKGKLFLNDKQLTSLYKKEQIREEYLHQKEHSKLTVFVKKVECLRAELCTVEQYTKTMTFYFSQLKLVKVKNIHPKDLWERSQQYFKKQIQGLFLTLSIFGSQIYKNQMNIYGNLFIGEQNVKAKFIKDGFAQISKNAQKYISQQQMIEYERMSEEAKKKLKGMWKDSKIKNNKQIQSTKKQIQYQRWEQMIKNKETLKNLNNEDEEVKQLIEQFRKLGKNQLQGQSNNFLKWDYSKLKIIVDTITTIFIGCNIKKHIRSLQEGVKVISEMFSLHVLLNINYNVDNIDFLKLVSKGIIYLLFFISALTEIIVQEKQKHILLPGLDSFEKIMKLLFRISYLGNQTFHDKIFGRKKDFNYQQFNFNSPYLSGGISSSSYSECSDGQQLLKNQHKDKSIRKIKVAQLKVRQNVTCLLSQVLKVYPSLVQNYWQHFVTANILSVQFIQYLRQLQLMPQQKQMTTTQKQEIVSLMRSNFGDHCLILLTVFQQDNKVKVNVINCFKSLLLNLQSKKILATTETTYIEKLLKHTKSSFVPKSFIIFSGLRNALYFLLISLHYEKNLQTILALFSALKDLCQNCQLIDKMIFEDGVGLLLKNYIIPVLNFSWQIEQLNELKKNCINFLSVLVSSKTKWKQIQSCYLLNESKSIWKDPNNINGRLINVLSNRLNLIKVQMFPSQDALIKQIMNFFTKVASKYFSSLFANVYDNESIWTFLTKKFSNRVDPSYSCFLQQVSKCYYDLYNSSSMPKEITHTITGEKFGDLFTNILPKYSLLVTVQNYSHLLGIITYMQYSFWDLPSFALPLQFLLHCFYNSPCQVQNDNKIQQKITNKENKIQFVNQFPSLHSIRNNSLIRISLIKLIGYMSFCNAFSQIHFMVKCVNKLLWYSKQYTSLNCVIKITWGLANWMKSIHFPTLNNNDSIQYLIKHAHSERQKIASNCTRGIGFFLQHCQGIDILKLCIKTIIQNLSHTIIKVKSNATKTLQMVLQRYEGLKSQIDEDVLIVLQQNLLKNNLNLQTKTLQLFKIINYKVNQKRIISIYATMLKNLSNHTQMQYEFFQIKTLKSLRKSLLEEIFMRENQIIRTNKILSKDFLKSIYAFLEDCWSLHKETENNLFQREFQKSDQALKLIFNLQKCEQTNNEESIILTKEINFQVEASAQALITKIKKFSLQYAMHSNEEEYVEQWKILSQIQIKEGRVWIKHCAVHEQVGNDQLQI